MRARALLAITLLTLFALLPGTAAADPQVRCTFDDDQLDEVSGLVDGPEGPQVVNDSGNPSTVYRIDPADCAVAGTRAVPVAGRDVEDLARGADGTLWLADTGDNDSARSTVAMLRLPVGGGEIVTRLTYPDGPHDAEALLLPGDARPVIVTKELGGRSAIYTVDAPLPPVPTTVPIPLRRVGDVVVPASDTPNAGRGASALVGGRLVTGGAVSADGRVVALRTYSDAWLYPAGSTATAEDVVAALRGTPVRVPLPNEPQGEAIAFAADGTLLSAGESPFGSARGALRAVPGATALVGAAGTPTAPTAERAATPTATDRGPDAGALVAVVAGLAVVVILVLVAVRRRRRARGDAGPR
jgi:hypothetical protein